MNLLLALSSSGVLPGTSFVPSLDESGRAVPSSTGKSCESISTSFGDLLSSSKCRPVSNG